MREKEVAIRSAIGAKRRPIVRQLLVEVGVLSAIGGIVGVLIAVGGVAWFDRAVATNPPPFWMTLTVGLSPRLLKSTRALLVVPVSVGASALT